MARYSARIFFQALRAGGCYTRVGIYDQGVKGKGREEEREGQETKRGGRGRGMTRTRIVRA